MRAGRLTAKFRETSSDSAAGGKVSGDRFGRGADDEIPGDRDGQSLGGKIPGDRAGRDPAVLLRETGPIGSAGGKTGSRCSLRSGCVRDLSAFHLFAINERASVQKGGGSIVSNTERLSEQRLRTIQPSPRSAPQRHPQPAPCGRRAPSPPDGRSPHRRPPAG